GLDRLAGMVRCRLVAPPVSKVGVDFSDAAGEIGAVARDGLHLFQEALHRIPSGISRFAGFNHGRLLAEPTSAPVGADAVPLMVGDGTPAVILAGGPIG